VAEIHIDLPPTKNNRGAVLRGLSNYRVQRENGFTIITIQIGDETIIIRVPP